MRCIVAGLMLTLACVVAYLPHGWFNRPFLMWDTYYFEQTIKSLVAAVTTATILTLPFRVRLSVEEQIVS
jgi:cell shape-determining protein MreD